MEQIHVVFSEKDVDRVADSVVQHGLLQVVDSAEMEQWAQTLTTAGTGEETAEMQSRRERVERLLKALNLEVSVEEAKNAEGSWQSLDEKVAEIERDVEGQLHAREEAVKELGRLEELESRIHEVPSLRLPLVSRDAHSYLAVETGRIADENMEILRERLGSILHVLAPVGRFGGMTTLFVVALRRDNQRLQSALKEAGFQPLTLNEEKDMASPELFKELDEKIETIRKKIRTVEEELGKKARESGAFLRSVLYRTRREALKQRIMKYFRRTERTFLLSGWIPRDERERFVRKIRRATENRCIVEGIPAEDIPSVREGKIHVPVQLKNPPLFRPFELITSAYGIPAYRTIDPTPLLGISFLLMFGMMFGDVGHGFVLSGVGAFLAMKGRKASQKSAGWLLFYGGCFSMVFGLLFGSVFGVEDLLPALWMKPMESITQLFRVAIFFGIGMVTLAIGINVLNGIRKKDILGAVFDKAGLLAVIVYWCGIVVATRMITTRAEASGNVSRIIPILMLVSVVLLFLKEPIVHLARGKRKLFPEGVATGIMGGIVELLEIFLGFLANTVSFIRVAAFGLAHAGLFMAIFALSDAVRGMAGGVVSVLVLIAGNVVIICLEGLVVTIQAVRLEFYEFFSRFFEQGNVAYRPLSEEMKA